MSERKSFFDVRYLLSIGKETKKAISLSKKQLIDHGNSFLFFRLCLNHNCFALLVMID
jgi:hypothetical protein